MYGGWIHLKQARLYEHTIAGCIVLSRIKSWHVKFSARDAELLLEKLTVEKQHGPVYVKTYPKPTDSDETFESYGE